LVDTVCSTVALAEPRTLRTIAARIPSGVNYCAGSVGTSPVEVTVSPPVPMKSAGMVLVIVESSVIRRGESGKHGILSDRKRCDYNLPVRAALEARPADLIALPVDIGTITVTDPEAARDPVVSPSAVRVNRNVAFRARTGPDATLASLYLSITNWYVSWVRSLASDITGSEVRKRNVGFSPQHAITLY